MQENLPGGACHCNQSTEWTTSHLPVVLHGGTKRLRLNEGLDYEGYCSHSFSVKPQKQPTFSPHHTMHSKGGIVIVCRAPGLSHVPIRHAACSFD